MLMVEHIENNWHPIYEELLKWRVLLEDSWIRDKLAI